MSFSQLGLSDELLRAVAEQGYKQPTPIQSQTIPLILQGRDILAGAQTGTGKTAGFTLPLLQQLSKHPVGHKAIKALILTPTRELAAQVHESVNTYGKHLPLRAEVVFGGVNINAQIKRLHRGVDILIATPGRLLDLIQQRVISLAQVEIFVLDEADRMLDMGFIHDIRKVIAMLPKKRQTLLFSATFADDIKKLATQLLNSPAEVEVASRNAAADTVSQRIYPVERQRKRELLSYLIGSGNWQQVLVFVRTKYGADRLSKQLQRDGIRSNALHGDKSQGARTKALDFFKTGKVSVLVATDIAARGLDIDQLPHVINFDLPAVPEDYVHRIGRTGRAGINGEALSLVCQEEVNLLAAIEKLLKRKIPRITEPGYETTLTVENSSKKSGNRKSPKNSQHPAKNRPAKQRRQKQDAAKKPHSKASARKKRSTSQAIKAPE